MVTVGLLVRLVAKPGKEAEVISDDAGRQAHLRPSGRRADGASARAAGPPPVIEPVDVLASELPG
jgi:hypothetical protein